MLTRVPCICYIFIRLSLDGHLGCFHFFTIVCGAPVLFCYFFFFFNLFLLVYNTVVVFAIHWHESGMVLHVFPIPSPACLPIPSLWVFPVHQQRKPDLRETRALQCSAISNLLLKLILWNLSVFFSSRIFYFLKNGVRVSDAVLHVFSFSCLMYYS